MFTSYFAKYKAKNGISIAIKSPNWFDGNTYPLLFPHWNFLKQYFKDKNESDYIFAYNKEILSKLNPEEVYANLNGMVLLCWEKSGKFCHRRIVAEWIETSLGIEVPEL